MSNEKKDNAIERAFRASLLILATIIALNLAVAHLRSVQGWVIAGAATIVGGWVIITVVRWRRSRW